MNNTAVVPSNQAKPLWVKHTNIFFREITTDPFFNILILLNKKLWRQ
ncbi:MAG: hypothetical protein WB779_02180 [Ignavibacteriaceae bacterium]